MSSERIKELQKQIAELKRRWPAHLAPPTLLEQLDELEAELKEELNKATAEKGNAKAAGSTIQPCCAPPSSPSSCPAVRPWQVCCSTC